jgi:NADH:ubiquinone oxidoreductase subunit F (NADH-binding)
MMEILERLATGEGCAGDLETLERLSKLMIDCSLCGLGQGAPLPLLDTLEHFRYEYENRIKQSIFLRILR